jgi:unsaturated chondroitin disaccharide hydrolase
LKNVIVLAVVLCYSANLLAYSGDGNGSEKNPYQIADVNDLLELTSNTSNYTKCFILTADIDLEGETFTTAVIAPDTSTSSGFQGTQFTGIFNGNSHTISNLTITSPTQDYVGLFGYVGSGAQIDNLGIENVNITGRSFVGGLVGGNDGSLIHCHATGSVNGERQVGGLVGRNDGLLTNCYVTGSASGTCFYTDSVGGLAGDNFGTLTACYATGSIGGTGSYANSVGGLVGDNSGMLIACYATGSISGPGLGFGGLVGQNSGSLISCYATGSVSGDGSLEPVSIGGLVGENWGTLIACFWDTQTSSKTIGVGYGTSAGVTGKTTAEMKKLSTFISPPARWDFTNETTNGSCDFWRMCADGADYPRLNWQSIDGDLACPNGVNTEDLDTFIQRWLSVDCTSTNNNCAGTDITADGTVDLIDYTIFAAHWLEGLNPDLVGYWEFNEANGNTARDSSGCGNRGFLVNNPQWTGGNFNGAIRFNGNDNAVEINAGSMNIEEGTISLWALPEAFYNSRHFLFGHAVAADGWSNRIQLYTNVAGELQLGFGDNAYLHTGIKTLQAGKWYHIVLVWDHSVYKVYVDGIMKASGNYSGFTALNAYADIGNNGNRSMRSDSFFGIIDEVCIYKRALDDKEVYSLFSKDFETAIKDVLAFSTQQLTNSANNLSVNGYPCYTSSYTNWITSLSWYWTSGFFPGCLWFSYENTGDIAFKTLAENWTAGLENQAYTSPLHDIGFIIFCSFGNGYRITNDPEYKDVLLAAADRLSNLYNPLIGAINLGWGNWQNPIAIDTMMNIEMLFWGAKNGGEAVWADMASNHAYRTLHDLVRNDGSTYQIADYNSVTGELISLGSLQGYGSNSTWSRGQGWAIYGFTMAYRETGDPNFLQAARKVADYYIQNLPSDYVPYWDFDAPGIPLTEKDSSAAAVAASGLLELSTFITDTTDRAKYSHTAYQTLVSLCKSHSLGGYLGRDVEGNSLTLGILMHGCQNHPESVTHGTIVDESLVWGDYYFLKALLQLKD